MALTHGLPISIERAVVTRGGPDACELRFHTLSGRDRVRLADFLTARNRASPD